MGGIRTSQYGSTSLNPAIPPYYVRTPHNGLRTTYDTITSNIDDKDDDDNEIDDEKDDEDYEDEGA